LPPAHLEGRDQYFHISHDDKCSEDEVTRDKYTSVLAMIVWTELFQAFEGQEHDERSLPECIENPSSEDPAIEVGVLKANLVESGSVSQQLFGVLGVLGGEPDNGQGSVASVERYVKQGVVDH